MWSKLANMKLLIGLTVALAPILALACSAEEAAAPAAPQAAAPAAPAPVAQVAPAASAPAPSTSAPVAAPTRAPTTSAAPSAPSGPKPSGTLTIAVADTNTPGGLPRFCSAGCAEHIYMSGITDVLFNSKLTPEGTVTTEPMLALSFELDPSLEFGDFTLRQGVQFHQGWGEMTAADVEYSFNDANSVTNPESIHGQAGDFAPLIASMEALDTYTVRLHYRNYDSRGVLHRFSRFWQTAAIMSKNVFDELGVEATQDALIGVGAFENDEWEQDKSIVGHAFADYWGTSEGWGPFVENARWFEIPEGASRRAMLETGEAQVAQVGLKDLPELIGKGFAAMKKAEFNTIDNISMTGNYWEKFGALTGAELERDRDTSKPHVGDPFEGGGDFDANTPSMVSSRLVRNAFAWSIQREELLENLLGGLGFVNYQPYNSSNSPAHDTAWDWGTDFDKAKGMLDEAGYADGFEMDLWVGTGELGAEIGESVGAAWQQHLGVKVNLIKTAYSVYRPGLVARTTNTPFTGCGDENKSNFPYDWAHGFVMSSISAGGYGVGMEIPWASESYTKMAGEPDKAKREAMSASFFESNAREALCVGIFERPLWPAIDPDAFVGGTWDMRPMANGNLFAINNIRTVKLK